MGFLADLEWEVCAHKPEAIFGGGLRFPPTQAGQSLKEYDMVIVPGGFGAMHLASDTEFIAWLRTARGLSQTG